MDPEKTKARRVNQKKREIKELKKEQVLQKTLKNDGAVEDIASEIKEVQKEIDEIDQQKPENWDQIYGEFKKLMKDRIYEKFFDTHKSRKVCIFLVMDTL